MRTEPIEPTKNTVFNDTDHALLASLVLKRFGGNVDEAFAGWMRLLQNNCTLNQFEKLLHISHAPHTIPDAYRVSWIIDSDAPNAWEAAKEARNVQLDRGSEAVVFHVLDGQGRTTVVDLLEEEE